MTNHDVCDISNNNGNSSVAKGELFMTIIYADNQNILLYKKWVIKRLRTHNLPICQSNQFKLIKL